MITKSLPKTFKDQSITYDGLKVACKHSNRDGKWSTPSEVSRLIPKDINTESNLGALLRKGSIEKKTGAVLYRPTGMADSISINNRNRGERRGGDEEGRRDDDRGSRRTEPSRRRTTNRRPVRNNRPKTQRRRKTTDNKKGPRRTGNNVAHTTVSLLSSVLLGGGGGSGSVGMR